MRHLKEPGAVDDEGQRDDGADVVAGLADDKVGLGVADAEETLKGDRDASVSRAWKRDLILNSYSIFIKQKQLIRVFCSQAKTRCCSNSVFAEFFVLNRSN